MVRVIAAIVLTMAVDSSVVRAQGANDNSQTVKRIAGKRLVDHDGHSARPLIVVDTADQPLRVGPDAGTALTEWLAIGADAALVVEVQDVESAVTAAQDWIKSRITVLVIDVLKGTSQRRFAIGSTFTFDQNGGEAVLEGRRVIAQTPGLQRPFKPGKRYLIFLAIGNGGTILIGPETSYELLNNHKFVH